MRNLVRSSVVNAKSMAARSSLVARLATVIRDQANTIVRLRLTDSPFVVESGEALLLAHAGPHVDLFVDVGGNKGEWTALAMEASRGAASHVVFEPGTRALEILRARFSGAANVRIEPSAVGEVPGETTFFEEENAGGTSSCVPGVSHGPLHARHVRVLTLDSCFADTGVTVGFLKVDAEGLDAAALRGAARLLEAKRVSLLQFEYNSQWIRAGETLTGTSDRLERFGYRIGLLRNDGIYFPHERYGEHYGQSNYLAWTPEFEPHLRPLFRGVI